MDWVRKVIVRLVFELWRHCIKEKIIILWILQGLLEFLNLWTEFLVCLVFENVFLSCLTTVFEAVLEFLELAGQKLLLVVDELLLGVKLRHRLRRLNVALDTEFWTINWLTEIGFSLSDLTFWNEPRLSRWNNIRGCDDVWILLDHALDVFSVSCSKYIRHADDLSDNTWLHFFLHFLNRCHFLVIAWTISDFVQDSTWISNFVLADWRWLLLWTQLDCVEFWNSGWLRFYRMLSDANSVLLNFGAWRAESIGS